MAYGKYKKYGNYEKKELDYEQTKDKALRLLTFRAHSEKELSDKLRRAGATDENIEKTLEFCREYSFVNDEQYALSKVRDLKNLKKYGGKRIEAELKRLGVSGEDAAEAMAELEEDDEQERLYPLVVKKLGGDFEKKSVDRCIRYFIYRGYGFGDIKECIERAKGEADEI